MPTNDRALHLQNNGPADGHLAAARLLAEPGRIAGYCHKIHRKVAESKLLRCSASYILESIARWQGRRKKNRLQLRSGWMKSSFSYLILNFFSSSPILFVFLFPLTLMAYTLYPKQALGWKFSSSWKLNESVSSCWLVRLATVSVLQEGSGRPVATSLTNQLLTA